MTQPTNLIDPELDLVLERTIEATPERVWRAWTDPEQVRQWFAPAPWRVAECEIDLRPGGAFRTRMESPDGEGFDGAGCYLEVVERERLVWTDALSPGYRPAREPFFTVVLTIEPHGGGSRCVVRALHASPEQRRKHEEMGFQQGWGLCLDQLLEVVTREP